MAELSKLATIKESNKRGLKEENVVGESNTPNLSQIKKSP